jgi:hypothetical protein
MKILSQLVFGIISAGICAGICVGQERTTVGAAAAVAGGTKSIVQGRVVQDPGGQGIRKVKIILIGGSGQRRQPYEVPTKLASSRSKTWNPEHIWSDCNDQDTRRAERRTERTGSTSSEVRTRRTS